MKKVKETANKVKLGRDGHNKDCKCGTKIAHLWGAYAISLALSVVRRVSSVSTITTRNN